MSNKGWVLLNTITLALVLFCNFGFSTGFLVKETVADISYKYDTLFTPAGYAFSIWGVIFLMAISFVIYQWILLKRNDPKQYIRRTGIWFTISNLANISWLFCWTNNLISVSVVLILILLLSLCILTQKLRLELDDEPVLTIFFVWWPIAVYLGWIIVASVANIAAWFVSIGWEGGGIEKDVWAIIMIAVATALFAILLAKRNLRESAAVGVWAFVAIATRQWNSKSNVATAAIIASVILFILISIHAYKNRNYNIGTKIKRGEWK
jgi:hypothetical protein